MYIQISCLYVQVLRKQPCAVGWDYHLIQTCSHSFGDCQAHMICTIITMSMNPRNVIACACTHDKYRLVMLKIRLLRGLQSFDSGNQDSKLNVDVRRVAFVLEMHKTNVKTCIVRTMTTGAPRCGHNCTMRKQQYNNRLRSLFRFLPSKQTIQLYTASYVLPCNNGVSKYLWLPCSAGYSRMCFFKQEC